MKVKVDFEWQGHNFDAIVEWNGEDYEIADLHMVVGENRVDMVHFMGQFDEVCQFLTDMALQANEDDIAAWNEP